MDDWHPISQSKELPSLTLEQLFKKHEVRHIDVLYLDTEGHDWVILSQLDLTRYAPNVIIYEHVHLNEQERQRAEARLAEIYQTRRIGSNTFAKEISEVASAF